MQALLFDFDGVIVHTEPEYDRFFETLVRDMRLPVEHFAERLKGKRLVEALETEFPQFSPEQKGRIIEATRRFELSMNLPLVPGVLDFVRKSKARGYKVSGRGRVRYGGHGRAHRARQARPDVLPACGG